MLYSNGEYSITIDIFTDLFIRKHLSEVQEDQRLLLEKFDKAFT